MEFVITAFLFVLVFAMGWLLGGIHVCNQFRKRVEDIEAKYIEEQLKYEYN